MEVLELLREHDIAITDLCVELLQVLSFVKTPLSHDHFDIKVNETSPYRNMRLLGKKGIASKGELNCKNLYELVDHVKAHFVCDKYHKANDIQTLRVKGTIKSVLIKGICSDCGKQNKPNLRK